MSLCSCIERPHCARDWCHEAADWSVLQPPWGAIRPAQAKFMCDLHAAEYRKAMTMPIRGIDKPPYADDDWRGSLADCIRHAEIAMAFEDRNEHQRSLRREGYDSKFTPAQMKQILVLRRYYAALASDGKGGTR